MIYAGSESTRDMCSCWCLACYPSLTARVNELENSADVTCRFSEREWHLQRT